MRRALFIDCHGVLTDGARLPAEWQRLLGEFFPPRLGGTALAWSRANAVAFERSLARWRALELGADMGAFEERDRRLWLRDMCTEVGVVPPVEDEIDRLAQESFDYVTTRVHAIQPGAADALRELHRRGYVLYTASGDSSTNLDGYLRGMGVRHLFARTYGSNLVGVWKNSPRFYAAILRDAGVDPMRATAIDDDALRLQWARSCGMETLLVSRESDAAGHRVVRSFADVPDALE